VSLLLGGLTLRMEPIISATGAHGVIQTPRNKKKHTWLENTDQRLGTTTGTDQHANRDLVVTVVDHVICS